MLDKVIENADGVTRDKAIQSKLVASEMRAQRQLISFDSTLLQSEMQVSQGINRTVRDGRNVNRILRNEGSFPSTDISANNAYVNVEKAYKYFLEVHGRRSYNGLNAPISMTVHASIVGDSTRKLGNAIWTNNEIQFGDSWANIFNDFTVDVDVVAHEFAHGVVEHTANLHYFGEPGALNESFADVFGSLAKQYALNRQSVSQADWLIGEEHIDWLAHLDRSNLLELRL